MLPRNVLCYGSENPQPQATVLYAGPLSLLFTQGDLRYVRLGGKEVLRRIYVAVRDENWGTIGGIISELKVERSADRFRITYVSDHKERDIHFRWNAEITGSPEGMITYSLAGKALTAFRKNRIGICVHHPLEGVVGRPCRVERADGSVSEGSFPKYISPHQPFLNLRVISHDVQPGVTAEVRFEGDVFEMEDHRNWTDASFKSYSTPLSLPFPVELKAGTEVRQSVRLTIKGKAAAGAQAHGNVVTISTSGATAKLPPIGLGTASHGQPLSGKEIARLQSLKLAHLRADATDLERAVRESGAIGVPLELAVTLAGDAETQLKTLSVRARDLRARIARWLIFHEKEKSSSSQWVLLARRHLPKAPFLAGSNAYFTEVNRGRPDPNGLDGVCFSVNPQVHAFDNLSLAENCAAQLEAVESARHILGCLPVYVTPVTLKPRFNPSATTAPPPVPPGELPPQVDPRQMSLFCAVWTLASLKYLAQGGAAGVTCFETTGWRGVMETADGSPLPAKFRSIAGAVYPVWHVFAGLADFTGGEVVASSSDEPLAAESLVVRKSGRVRVYVANLSAETRRVRVPSALFPSAARVLHMNETNAETAMSFPESFHSSPGEPLKPSGSWLELSLLPYSLARIDSALAERKSL